MQTLDEVGRALRTRLGTDDIPKVVNTRVFLRTGVNLTEIKQTQNTNPALVTRVVGALADFGYSLF